MNILIALFQYFPWGGLQKDTLRVVDGAIARGHHVTVFTTAWNYPLPAGDVTIERVPARGLTNHARMRHFSDDFQLRLRQPDVDVSLAMNRVANADFYFAADSCMKTYLHSRHSALALALNPRYRAILKQEDAILSPYSPTKVLTIAASQIRDYTAAYGVPPQKLASLPPGMNPRCVRPAEPEAAALRQAKRSELGLADNDRLLILVGTNARRKGVDRVLQALAELPADARQPLVFALVGNDSTPQVNALAARLCPDLRFCHLGPRDDVHELLLAADLMVHPAREEGTGTVLVEALAAGLPVICSEACGFSPYVHDATGTVTPEPFALQDLTRLLADSLPRLSELRQQTIAYAKTQDFCARTDTILDFLEDFAKRHPRPSAAQLDDILQQHRAALAANTALKNSPKRKVTRVTCDSRPLIVKEYTGDGTLRNHALHCLANTRQLHDLSPACLTYHETPEAHFLIFESCGDGSCYQTETYARPDSLSLFRYCGILLATLHARGFYHNDTKPNNFVPNLNCPDLAFPVAIVDCDSLTHYTRLPYARQLKNVATFLGGTNHAPDDTWLQYLSAFLHGYRDTLRLSNEAFRKLYADARKLVENHRVESWLHTCNRHLPPFEQLPAPDGK